MSQFVLGRLSSVRVLGPKLAIDQKATPLCLRRRTRHLVVNGYIPLRYLSVDVFVRLCMQRQKQQD